MSISSNLKALGIELVKAPEAKGSYTPTLLVDGTLYVSGTLPLVGDEILHPGVVGVDITLDEAREAAHQCMVNMLSRLSTDLGDLERIERWVKLTGFVASAPGFNSQPQVINAASDLVVGIFEDAGVHTRSAVGVAALPMAAPVEIEAIIKVRV